MTQTTDVPSATDRPHTVGPVTIALFVALITVAAFLPATRNQFLLWDDNIVIYQNPHLAHSGFFWRHPYYQLYTPVTDTIYACIAALFRLPTAVPTPLGDPSTLSPAAFHAVSVVFHAANAVLVFYLIRLLLPRPATLVRNASAAVGALVFALHPLQVEAVAWITGANNLYSGFFTLLALILYVRAAEADYQRRHTAYIAFFVTASLSFALALLAKPTAVTAPLAAAAIDYGILRRSWRQSAPLLLWLAMSAAITVITRGVQPPHQVVPMGPLWFRPFLMLEALAFYLMKLVAPVSLGVDYGLTPHYALAHTPWYVCWVAPAALGGLLWLRRRAWPVESTAAAFSALCLLPTIGLVASYSPDVPVVADRYVYLAMFGPGLAIASALSRSRPRYAFPAAAAVLAALSVLSVMQIHAWSDTNTIMTQTLTVNPNSWSAHWCRAVWRWRSGDMDGSIDDGRATLRINPDCYNAIAAQPGHLVTKWMADGQPASEVGLLIEAEGILRHEIKMAPNYPFTYSDLGDVYMCLGRPADASTQYAAALSIDPRDPTLRQKLRYCLSLQQSPPAH